MLGAKWRCFVINLKRSAARLETIKRQLDGAGIAFERFEGFDGGSIDPDRALFFDRRSYEAHHGKLPTAGEIGCFMSHIGVMRAFLATDAEFCLVLEDDAIVEASLALLLDDLAGAAPHWDVVLLYGNHPGMPFTQVGLNHRHRLVGFFTRQTGAVAYALNRHAAATYLRELLPMSLPIDIDFDRAWDFGIKFRGVLPFPVRTGAHLSDIGLTGRKFAWYRRFRTYAWRTHAAVCRLIHYSVRDPIWLRPALRFCAGAFKRASGRALPDAARLPPVPDRNADAVRSFRRPFRRGRATA